MRTIKPIYTSFICGLLTQVISAGVCNAQTIELKAAPASVVIDGNASEWGDLNYTNDKAKISYSISKDKDNLYLVVKTKDAGQRNNILGSGITWAINTQGKKKGTYTTTFPVNDQDDASGLIDMNTEALKLQMELLQHKKIKLQGFSANDEEPLASSNPGGIITAIGCDENGFLTYEEAIPLKLFPAAVLQNKEWAFNIKINGLEKRVTLRRSVVETPVTERGTRSISGRIGGSSGMGPVNATSVNGPVSVANTTVPSSPSSTIGSGGTNVITGDTQGPYTKNLNGPDANVKIVQLTSSYNFWEKVIMR